MEFKVCGSGDVGGGKAYGFEVKVERGQSLGVSPLPTNFCLLKRFRV